jgi:hypothetical protein
VPGTTLALFIHIKNTKGDWIHTYIFSIAKYGFKGLFFIYPTIGHYNKKSITVSKETEFQWS